MDKRIGIIWEIIFISDGNLVKKELSNFCIYAFFVG